MSLKDAIKKLDNKLFGIDDTDDEEFEYEYKDDEDFVLPYFYNINIIEIVLTGGPCSGKSEFSRLASDELKKRNIPVFIVTETATELLKGNLDFNKEPLAFQKAVCSVQLQKEKAVMDYAASYLRNKSLTNAVVIYDRSAWDGRAYLDDNEWVKNVGRKCDVYESLGNRFVIHLESAAAIGKFSKDNNEERYENEERATKIDKRLFDIYRSHPFFAYVPARDDYEQKKAEFLKLFTAHVESRLVPEEGIK